QVGRSNRYRAAGAPWDLERALGQLRVPIRAVTLARDTLGPAGALRALLDKMPQAHPRHVRLDDGHLGARSDHFAWMKTPAAVVAALRDAPDHDLDGAGISQRD
ncbi:alpha/beta fold hydrolase, partial [Xanthomonas euvesicatoria]